MYSKEFVVTVFLYKKKSTKGYLKHEFNVIPCKKQLWDYFIFLYFKS